MKLPVSCATADPWSSTRRECLAKRGHLLCKKGLLMYKHLLARVHAFRAWHNVLQKSAAARMETGLCTSWQAFLFPELNVCQAPFHQCCNSMFVQTRQCGKGCYLNCFQWLHKRLSMRSCNYSEVLIMSWHDMIVLALHTSVGVFLKEVAFVAPSLWLLLRSHSLHQGDI